MIEIVPNQTGRTIKTKVPTSKSYTNRALLLAALANGTTLIKNPLTSDDTIIMIEALKSLGVKITKPSANQIKITGTGGKLTKPSKAIYLGNAGTAVRFMTAALASQPFKTTITGDKRMQQRPLTDLISALTKLGSEITSKKDTGCPPITITGPFVKNKTKVKGNISSQYLSALIMIAPYNTETTEITVTGSLTSQPYVKMTLDIIKTFGVTVKNENFKKFIIKPQKYQGTTYQVEGDASSATYPLAIAAINENTCVISNLTKHSKQADLAFLDLLKKMGCKTTKTEESISCTGPKQLKPLGTIDLNTLPDAAMTVAIVCAFAEGKSKLTGLANLRVKESDRLSALATELTKIGAKVKEGKDYIEIDGNPTNLRGNKIKTYNDHRIAMCFAVVGTKVPNIKILNEDCVNKTYPEFWKDLKKWGINTTTS